LRAGTKLLLATALVLAATAAEAQSVQYGVRPRPTIYLCADDPDLAGRLQSELPSGYTVVDGNIEPPPTDTAEVTFAFIGRHEASAYAASCIDRYPGATEYLYKVAKDASEYEPMFTRYVDRSGVVSPRQGVGTISWEQGGQFTEWFVGYCFLSTPDPCFVGQADPEHTLIDMAR
jgi:hypothetical protein